MDNGQLKKGYKRTEVGVIPGNWDVTSIQASIEKKYIEDHIDGNHGELYPRSHEFVEHGVPYIGANDFSDGLVNFKNCKYLSKDRANKFKKGIARNGDVLFAHNATVGPVALLNYDEDFVILSTTATYFRCNTERLNNFYFRYVLEAQYLVRQYRSVMAQSTRFQVPITTQRKFIFAIPPIKEQHAIATALSDVEALTAVLDKLIAKKHAIKTAAMQQLLTGKKRLPGFGIGKGYKQTEVGMVPEDWILDRIKNLASITTGSRNTQDRMDNGEFPFFVRSQTVERIGSYSFDGEAVLTAGDGVGTGKVFHYINGKFDYHQRVYKISNFKPELNGFYFYNYFRNRFYDRIMSMTAKSSVDSVRMEMIADMNVILPEPKEQLAIAIVLSNMDAEITALEARRNKTQAIKQGMMQELLTGRTRLI